MKPYVFSSSWQLHKISIILLLIRYLDGLQIMSKSKYNLNTPCDLCDLAHFCAFLIPACLSYQGKSCYHRFNFQIFISFGQCMQHWSNLLLLWLSDSICELVSNMCQCVLKDYNEMYIQIYLNKIDINIFKKARNCILRNTYGSFQCLFQTELCL